MPKRKIALLGIFLVPLTVIFSQCFNLKNEKDPRGKAYAGSSSCISCHKNIYDSHTHTAHFIASQPASGTTIQGSFAKGLNEFVFNPNLKVVMEKRDTGFYQTGYEQGKATQSQRFDIVFGGVKGQTYAYWVANELFQLPVSCTGNTHTWINSPGYDPNRIAFERIIGTQCLDCHASYIKKAAPAIPGFYNNYEGFEKSTLLYGIDCERCHGPAAEHVKYHLDNPEEKQAKFIKVFKSLTREQKINMCAVCHSGADNHIIKPTFGFKPSDTLSKYMRIKFSNAPVNYNTTDVHGNQRGLLESSRCFTGSKMDCSTCHNTHVNERNNFVLYAARCQTCHSRNDHNECKLVNRVDASILTQNCISCHMPAFPSRTIIAGEALTLIHTHHIAIYPEEAKKILAQLKISYHNL